MPFENLIIRWNISPIETLPQCMKVVFDAILQVCSEMEMVTTKEGTSKIVMPHVKQAVIKHYILDFIVDVMV